MVEGYFDFAQAFQAGVQNVVASSGTALTPAQARLLKRFAAKVVLSFDPDAAGQGAAAKSSELLVAEGFQVNVAMLPAGQDPDTFHSCERRRGLPGRAADLAANTSNTCWIGRPRITICARTTSAGSSWAGCSTVAARIPDAAARDQFADRLAHKARITEEVVRAEIRKAAVQKQTVVERRHVPALGQVKTFERGLIWALVRDPVAGFGALAELEGDRPERAGDWTDSRAGAIPAGMAVRGLTTGLTGASKYTGSWAGRAKLQRSRSPRCWSPPTASSSSGGCSWRGNGPTSSARWIDSSSRAFPAATSGSTNWGCGSWRSSSR